MEGSVAVAVFLLSVVHVLLYTSAQEVVPVVCVNRSEWLGVDQTCYSELNELLQDSFYHELLASPTEQKLETVCKTYQKWLACMTSLYEECGMERPGPTLSLAERLVSRTCNQAKETTLHNLPCLVSQSGEANPLFRGCSSLMDLQAQSGVFDTCSVARQYVECEDRLLRSACGSNLADFTLALSIRSKFRQLGVHDTCTFTPLSNYKGFSYTMHCSPSFPVRMRVCNDAFQETKVALYHNMLAIIRGTTAELDNWCRAYHQYEECMEPISNLCPLGVEAVYNIENEWHRLVMVADYLCGQALDDYKYHLSCYTSMMRHSSSFNLCRKVFDRYPTKYEAYKVKCSPTKAASRINMQKREKLIECFTSFTRRDCGLNASITIEPLIRMQYSFDFLPPCEKTSSPTCPDTVRNAAAVTKCPGYLYVIFTHMLLGLLQSTPLFVHVYRNKLYDDLI